MGDVSEVVEKIRAAFAASYAESDSPASTHKLEITTEGSTGEQFLTLALAMPSTLAERDSPWEDTIVPVLPVYATLVAESGFEYPLEVVGYHTEGGQLTAPVVGFRVSVLWIREFKHGNISLQGLLDRVLGTLKGHEPETLEEAMDWMPEYSPDWRQNANMFSEGELGEGATSYTEWKDAMGDGDE